jgi:hypothetical protein
MMCRARSFMRNGISSILCAALFAGAACFCALPAFAGSCCGGGSPTALLVPKYARAVADLSFDVELYDGYWDQYGKHKSDPDKSDLQQYRLNLGAAYRFARDWQASIILPYVWNENKYSGDRSSSSGLGDTTLSLWYEAIDDVAGWKIKKPSDLIPGVTLGLGLLIPTGISPYDDEKSSFDITGRGFYRLDGNLLIEKTIQPWNVSLALTYGTYFERPVNREYGKYVQPYREQLGDRFSTVLCAGYRFILGTGGDTITTTASYSYLHEDGASFNGVTNPDTPFSKQSAGLALSYANLDQDWSARISWNHAIADNGWGRNFPTTDIFTVGVRYVFR